VYAVGSVLFEMLSGAPLRRQIQDLLLPPEVVAERLRAAGVDGALSNVVMSMLRREPSERPASVREVAAQLRRSSASQRNAPVRGAPPASLPSMRMPLPNDDPGLVILPLQADPATAELATSLSEELADILSRTRGLRVLAASVGAKMVGRDPRAVGMELGVQYVVEGRFRMLQNHVRVSIRVIDARDGSQRYTERFEAMLQNVFEMQDRMARQIADALRVELAAHRDEGSVPVEAVHAYFDGRRRTRMAVDPSNSGYDQLRMALELAPRFEAAHAALALAAVRAWFAAGTDSEVWHTRARLAVRRALDLAPALPESHLAAGMFASQLGDYTQAAHSLARALVLAPTCAEAQAYLGQLECEAGSAEQGAQRIDFARSLDPQLVIGLDYVARHRALTGDHEGAAHMLERYAQIAGKHHPMVMASRVRFAMWRGEARPARSLLVQLVDTTSSAMQGLRLYLGVVSGELHPEVFVAAMVDFQRTITNPRFVTLGFQLGAEALAWRGALPLAMQQLEAATRAALVDVAWLEGCPALAPLHTQPGWDHTVAYVRARAAAVWSRGVTTR
jgi:serine/threonine-protein kinase